MDAWPGALDHEHQNDHAEHAKLQNIFNLRPNSNDFFENKVNAKSYRLGPPIENNIVCRSNSQF